MLKFYLITIGTEHNMNRDLRVVQNPGFTYLHSVKRSRKTASLRPSV